MLTTSRQTGNGGSRRRLDDPEGSLVLTLLAAIVIGSLVVVLFAATLSGQRAVQQDRSFINAVHAADAGVEAALTQINTKEADGRVDVGTPLASAGAIEMEGDLTFTFDAEKVSRYTWHVTAVGTATDAAGRVRTIEAVLEAAPLIEFAAFAKTKAGFAGGNTADSYNAFTDATDTGKGIIGSNGHIVIGRASTATGMDGIELHDFFDDPDDPTDDDQDDIPSRVTVCANAECKLYHVLEADGGKIMGVFEKRLVVDDWWIGASLTKARDVNPSSPYYDPHRTRPAESECNVQLGIPGTVPTSLSFRDDDTVVIDGGTPIDVGPSIPPGVYCAGSGGVTFAEVSGDRTIEPGSTSVVDGLVTDPVIVYTSGPVTVGNQLTIGCATRTLTVEETGEPDTTMDSDCPSSDPKLNTPLAPRLQVYSNLESTSAANDAVISTQADIAAILYFPNANCGGGAGVDIYGALVCRKMDNVGGWSFHFDQASSQIKRPEFRVVEWREEVGGSTSF